MPLVPPDGHIGNEDYPEYMPDLTAPPKPVPHWAKEVPDALNREDYIRIGRPILVAAGHLKPEEANRPPALPKMPNTPKKVKTKAANPPVPPKTEPAPSPPPTPTITPSKPKTPPTQEDCPF